MEYRKYREFSDKALALDLMEKLKVNGIASLIKENSSPLGASFGNTELSIFYEIHLIQQNFDKADQLLENEAEEIIKNLPSDYYLFEFENEELFEVVDKPDEWSEIDNKLAIKLLNERGINLTDEWIKEAKTKRIEKLAEPEKSQTEWVILVYIIAFFGVFLGILSGWFMWHNKKTLPNGDKVYTYSEGDRKHGKRVFFLGIIMTMVYITWKFIK